MLNAFRRSGARRAVVEHLYENVSLRARAAVFFRALGVADTIDGRFDMLVLHAWLLMDELQRRQRTDIGQQFIDTLFVQFDAALRELGAGDVGMNRRMKKMSAAFFGRLEAYRGALTEQALAEAIARNVYRGEKQGIEHAGMLATYCASAGENLANSRLEIGEADFGPLPAGGSLKVIMDTDAPIQRMYDLGTLSEAGYEKTVTASDAELARIAEWEGVEAVTRFEARVRLERLTSKRFRYEAELGAEVVQGCVVTLEPVRTSISRGFSRELHYIPGRHGEKADVVTLSAIEDEETEEIGSLKFDLAGPLLEEFSLAVDPYPRAPGVAFDLPADEVVKPDNPFSVLKSLKRG